MANTSPIYARIDTKLKQDAEKILEKLGITPTSLITMVYSQVVLKEALPFTPTLNNKHISCFVENEEQLSAAIKQGIKDVEDGNVISEKDAEVIFKSKYGL